jgi:hypothetical protein
MTRSERTALLALQRVEDGLTLGFDVSGLGGVLTEDEGAGDEADEEGDEVGDHGLGEFREEGFDLGFELGDAFGVGLLGQRLRSEGDREQILVRHVGVAEHLATVLADEFDAVFRASPGLALWVLNHV